MMVMWQSCEIIILWLQVTMLRPRNSRPPHTYIITHTHTHTHLALFSCSNRVFHSRAAFLYFAASSLAMSNRLSRVSISVTTIRHQHHSPFRGKVFDFTMTIHTLANRVYNDLWWQGIRLCPLKTCAHGETIGCQSTRKLRQWLPQYQ